MRNWSRFSVERDLIKTLPTIAEEFEDSDTTIVVKDSKMGWAKAYRELFSLLIGGQVPKWDTSKVRAAGERLKTFGGRASGPEPLEDLFRFTVDTFRKANGRKLTSIECHDIICKIAEIVVVGGVRRSALISLITHRRAYEGCEEWCMVGKQIRREPLRITPCPTKKSQSQAHSWKNGSLCTSQRVVSVESSTVKQHRSRLKRQTHSEQRWIQNTEPATRISCLEPTLALKSFFETVSSATSRKSLYAKMTHPRVWHAR